MIWVEVMVALCASLKTEEGEQPLILTIQSVTLTWKFSHSARKKKAKFWDCMICMLLAKYHSLFFYFVVLCIILCQVQWWKHQSLSWWTVPAWRLDHSSVSVSSPSFWPRCSGTSVHVSLANCKPYLVLEELLLLRSTLCSEKMVN